MMSKNLLVAGYPRSGNTWLGLLLCYVLNAKYIDIQLGDDVRLFDLPDQWPDREPSDFGKILKTHAIGSQVNVEFDALVYIVRDPRDVAVSFYYYTVSKHFEYTVLYF